MLQIASVLLGGLALSAPLAPLGDKLHGDLAQVISTAPVGVFLPVTITMSDQVPESTLSAASELPDKAARRAAVIGALRQLAEPSQAALLEVLVEEEAAGRAAEVRPLWIANVVSAQVTPALALEIAERDDVAWVHHDPPHGEEIFSSVAAPAAVGGTPTCGLDLLDVPAVWTDFGIDGSGVVVGVIDTGTCTGHPDITNRLWINPCEIIGNGQDDDGNGYVDDRFGWNFGGNNPDVNDTNSHGSHVAGTVAGDGTGGTRSGVAPGAKIMTLRVSATLNGEAEIWEAMQYGLLMNVDLTTASLGWNHAWNPDRAMWRMVCENTIAGGVVVIYAAHNFGCGSPPDNIATPGDVPDVITIGAVDCGDNKAGFSSCGPITWQNVPPYNDHPYPPGLIKPTVAGPGVDTVSHDFCSGYSIKSGTSMATPHIAGVTAMLLQADPSLDQAGVTAILTGTAVDLGAPGNDNETGWGRVDAYGAVQMALANGNQCEAKVNSCGGTPLISSTGTPSASANSGFIVSGSNARGGNQVGLLAYTDAGLRFPPIPFDGGSLCINAPIKRGPLVQSGGTTGQCDGNYSVDWNAFASGSMGGNPASYLQVPGTVVAVQWWGRDTAGHGIYLTEAMLYTVCP